MLAYQVYTYTCTPPMHFLLTLAIPRFLFFLTFLTVFAPHCLGGQDDELLAYQVCFDLVENEMQSFLIKVCVCVCVRARERMCMCTV